VASLSAPADARPCGPARSAVGRSVARGSGSFVAYDGAEVG